MNFVYLHHERIIELFESGAVDSKDNIRWKKIVLFTLDFKNEVRNDV